ncbi:MAG: alpha/beta hydrolase [Caldilineaceae bacterium]
MTDLHAQLAAVRAVCPLQHVEAAGYLWPYLEAGSSHEVLLLLPGAMGTADTSFQYILAFQEQYRVLSLDYPGAIVALPPLIEGLAAALDALGVARAHVVGGSYSGLVSQFLAAAHPERVASLLLSNTGAPDPAYVARWRLAATMAAPLSERLAHAAMRATIRLFLPGSSPAQRFWREYFAAAIPHLRKQAMVARLHLTAEMNTAGRDLARRPYRGPVLIVDAGEDALVPTRQRLGLRALYPQAHCMALDSKGHVASLDEAEEYIGIYGEFLCERV